MSAHVLDGRRYAKELREALLADVRELAEHATRPGLATVVAGDSYPAHAYERRVRTLARQLGIHYVCEELPADVAEADAIAVVGKLGADPRVSGILILRPLPPQVSEAALYRALDPLKDIEAVHPVNAGLLALGRPRFVPSTPASVFHLLDRYLVESGRDPAAVYQRSNVVVVGRSANVGKPAITLGMERGATVISCDAHSYSSGLLYEHTKRADVLIVATGVAGLISAEHVKDGVIAIDVGINPVVNPNGETVRLVGDLDFSSVVTRAEAVTPVPGGVGPITDVWLLRNTVTAARRALSMAITRPLLEGLNLLTAYEPMASSAGR
ncbi:bifunctional 5,10-methylene-tetrahydrofolate dehydrogenase/5,10-methylene-tetrahydrofolate cyclohydrolase [Planosporangium flavigriseum]|uniref:Bifunctional protein FolD n=1 Tax=Planosporangium flavigriseum TaxID=373681 RepID=A0A8J3LX85_9ACTN|nr:tetrahydrofolate dehydrogenase/cyclohydrolase catalytic domain-containing protein [Planosporangium flavigriseum]NJC65523.1 bifunctional 5,10-methylene-tetrahydrofolate dehydrogenase/5,10-methylene-tetrahydrofolate cyclohydrolase [Planosporangium flavigriseum]GIG75040.1 bifunctional protein FolD [Planosporangium flavigriseum]